MKDSDSNNLKFDIVFTSLLISRQIQLRGLSRFDGRGSREKIHFHYSDLASGEYPRPQFKEMSQCLV